MKQLFAVAAVVAASLMVGSGAANAAQASLSGGIGVESYRPWAEAIQEIGHKKKNKHKHHKHKHRKHWGHHRKHNNGGVFFSFGSHGPVIHHKKQHRQYVRNCHGVVTDGHFRGRYAKIGGTMCYDKAGYGYIVDGSRYLIQYY